MSDHHENERVTVDNQSFSQKTDAVRVKTGLFATFGYYFGVVATYVATLKSAYGIAMVVLGMIEVSQVLMPLAVLAGGLLLMKLCHGTGKSIRGHASLACLVSAVMLAIEAIVLIMAGFFIPFAVCLGISCGLLLTGKLLFPENWLHSSSLYLRSKLEGES